MSYAIVLGLLSAILYGSTDFVARLAGRRVGPLRTIAYGHVLAAGGLSILMARAGLPSAAPATWLLSLLANVTGLIATLFLYRALTVGKLSLVTPVAATYGGITALLASFSGDTMNTIAWVGLAAIVLGGVLVARPSEHLAAHESSRLGLGAAIIAAFFYGVSFWIQGVFVIPRLGVLAPTWTYYVLGASLSWVYGRLAAQNMERPAGHDALAVAATTLLACGGTLCLAAGQSLGAVGVVTVLSALASGVTVLLGRLILKERIAFHGYAGLLLIVVGLAVLHP